jgi:hypothetical protein
MQVLGLSGLRSIVEFGRLELVPEETVDLAPVTDADDQDLEDPSVVVDPVDDAIVAEADPQKTLRPSQVLAAARTWLFGELLDRCHDSLLCALGQLAQLSGRGRDEGDLVGHSPSPL